MNLKNNEPFINDGEKIINKFFNSLKNIKPELENKNEIINKLIELNNQKSQKIRERSLVFPIGIFVISIIFVLFSSYFAYNALTDSNIKTAEAISITVSPAIESVSKNLELAEPAAIVLISLSFFCLMIIFITICIFSTFIYFFNNFIHSYHRYKPYLI